MTAEQEYKGEVGNLIARLSLAKVISKSEAKKQLIYAGIFDDSCFDAPTEEEE